MLSALIKIQSNPHSAALPLLSETEQCNLISVFTVIASLPLQSSHSIKCCTQAEAERGHVRLRVINKVYDGNAWIKLNLIL